MRHLSVSIPLGVAMALGVSACGVASVHPIVTDADVVFDSQLTGTWYEPDGSDSATIVAAANRAYRVTYTDGDGKIGRFEARLGTLGAFRVLDLQPDEPAPRASDMYRSLVLRAHSFLVIDAVTATELRFRMLNADSLKQYLELNPGATPHATLEHAILFTAESPQLRRFLSDFMRRPGALTKAETWRRR